MRRNRSRVPPKLIRSLRQIERLKLEFAEMAAQFTQSRVYRSLGYASAVDWLSDNCHMTKTEAADWIAIGMTIIVRPKRIEAPD